VGAFDCGVFEGEVRVAGRRTGNEFCMCKFLQQLSKQASNNDKEVIMITDNND
jgi:hypothetical protein